MVRTSFIRIASLVTLISGSACELDTNAAKKTDDPISTPDGDGDDGSSNADDAGAGDGDGDSDGSGGNDDNSGGGDEGGGGEDAGLDGSNPVDEEDAGTDGDNGDDGDGSGDVDAGTDPDPDPDPDAGVDDDPDASTGDVELPALVAHYTFDENDGASAADSAGDFAVATLLGAAGWTEGVSGSALKLPGGNTEGYASLPVDILDRCDDITIALWMKLGSVQPWSRLLDIDGGVNGFLFFTPAQDLGGTPHLYFNIYYPGGSGPADQGVSAAYPQGTTLVGEWHHVAFTLKDGAAYLYFDGAQIGAAALSVKPSDLAFGDNAHAWIGRSMFPDPYLDAAIDDLRVSCTAYSAEQIAELAK